MTEIVTDGTTLVRVSGILTAFAQFGANDGAVMTRARTGRLVQAVNELKAPWLQALNPKIREYTVDEENPEGVDKIGDDHPRYPEFEKDPEVREIMDEELKLEISPLRLSEIVALEERLDKRGERRVVVGGKVYLKTGLHLQSDDLILLMDLGFVMDDTEPAAEADPEPEESKPARGGRKSRGKA